MQGGSKKYQPADGSGSMRQRVRGARDHGVRLLDALQGHVEEEQRRIGEIDPHNPIGTFDEVI